MGLWVVPRAREAELCYLFCRCVDIPSFRISPSIFTAGINYESSFEAEILANTRHCEIWGYDYSVKSFGPQIPRSLASRTHFFPYGLAGSDKAATDDSPSMFTLESIMAMNGRFHSTFFCIDRHLPNILGHSHIDILKIDVEGWEFETLTALIGPYLHADKPLPFGQLQLEIHIWGKQFAEFLTWWETLEAAGLRPFWTEVRLDILSP